MDSLEITPEQERSYTGVMHEMKKGGYMMEHRIVTLYCVEHPVVTDARGVVAPLSDQQVDWFRHMGYTVRTGTSGT